MRVNVTRFELKQIFVLVYGLYEDSTRVKKAPFRYTEVIKSLKFLIFRAKIWYNIDGPFDSATPINFSSNAAGDGSQSFPHRLRLASDMLNANRITKLPSHPFPPIHKEPNARSKDDSATSSGGSRGISFFRCRGFLCRLGCARCRLRFWPRLFLLDCTRRFGWFDRFGRPLCHAPRLGLS